MIEFIGTFLFVAFSMACVIATLFFACWGIAWIANRSWGRWGILGAIFIMLALFITVMIIP